MYCTRCGIEVVETARFCSQCGLRLPVAGTAVRQALMLDKSNKKIAGVCAGFARYFECDIVLVRVLWLAIAFSTGVGFVAYLVAWIAIPSDHGMMRLPAPSPAAPAA